MSTIMTSIWSFRRHGFTNPYVGCRPFIHFIVLRIKHFLARQSKLTRSQGILEVGHSQVPRQGQRLADKSKVQRDKRYRS